MKPTGLSRQEFNRHLNKNIETINKVAKIPIDLKKIGSMLEKTDRDSIELAIGLLLEESGILTGVEDKRYEEVTILAGLLETLFLDLSDKERQHIIRLFAYKFDREFFDYLVDKSKRKDPMFT